ncbi:hypothetical protein BVRB_2g035100 [Beta vulgaris subsp. vulgaris]|nr:hypothetical protein BVRB_2g035100 [Beta vulgaris subsp. vulgaris]
MAKGRKCDMVPQENATSETKYDDDGNRAEPEDRRGRTIPVYIFEIAPQNLRGALGSVNQLSVTIGIMLSYMLGLFVPWRILAVLGNSSCCLAHLIVL